jgi:DNA mismatch repair protein MutL
VKFEDERTIYSILKSAVRRSLGKYHVAPAIDFDQEPAFGGHELPRPEAIKMPEIKINPNYNPFQSTSPTGQNQSWKRMFEAVPVSSNGPRLLPEEEVAAEPFRCFQFLNTYLVLRWKGQLLLVDQHRAHERILYETFTARAEQGKAPTQMALFPETIAVRPIDMPLMEEMLPYLRNLGFDAEIFGPGAVLVRGFPPEAVGHSIPELMERFLEEFKHNSAQMGEERSHQMYRKMAGNMAIKSGVVLDVLESETLIRNLMDCKMPWVSLNGKPILVKFSAEDLAGLFSR